MLALYVDSAVRSDAQPLLEMGIFRGLTTNPVLLRRAGLTEKDLPEVVTWATGLGVKEVFFQTWGDNPDELVEVGHRLAGLDPRVVVKVAATRSGTQAAARLAAEGVTVLMTAVYSLPQSLLAAAASCSYVAPYLGRMGDAGRPAHDEIIGMQKVLNGVDSSTKVLVASVRSPADVAALAQKGVSHFALPAPIAWSFFGDPFTRAAAEMFEHAARGEPF